MCTCVLHTWRERDIDIHIHICIEIEREREREREIGKERRHMLEPSEPLCSYSVRALGSSFRTWEFPKIKGSRKSRVLICTPNSRALVKRMAVGHPHMLARRALGTAVLLQSSCQLPASQPQIGILKRKGHAFVRSPVATKDHVRYTMALLRPLRDCYSKCDSSKVYRPPQTQKLSCPRLGSCPTPCCSHEGILLSHSFQCGARLPG